MSCSEGGHRKGVRGLSHTKRTSSAAGSLLLQRLGFGSQGFKGSRYEFSHVGAELPARLGRLLGVVGGCHVGRKGAGGGPYTARADCQRAVFGSFEEKALPESTSRLHLHTDAHEQKTSKQTNKKQTSPQQDTKRQTALGGVIRFDSQTTPKFEKAQRTGPREPGWA